MSLNSPELKELQAIVDWVNVTEDVRELSIKFGGTELFMSRNQNTRDEVRASVQSNAPAPLAPSEFAEPARALSTPLADEASRVVANSVDTLAPNEVLVKAPMVGTFYAAPKPGAPSFVSVGDTVKSDTVLCIVEVMKLMNNVEAQVAGTVARVLVDDNQAVEFGQPLFVIRRSE